jgi:hypothetical protein
MRELIDLLEAANPAIVDALQKQGHNVKIKGNQAVVLVQVPEKNKNGHRREILNDIQRTLAAENPELGAHLADDPKISSIGVVAFDQDPTKIVVKDIGVQGDQSAGVANEAELAKLIESVIEKYGSANVKFVDPRGNTLELKNVSTVEQTGKQVKNKETGQSLKADVVLKSKSKRLPISIKKLDAESWESADSSFGARAREIVDDLVDKGLVELIPIGDDNYKLSREIVVEPTEEEAIRAIFGGDLNPEGGIVIQTFKPEHFVQNGNNITVQCHAVIRSKADIPDSHLMVWLIRNQAGRLSKRLGIRGLRPMGSTLVRAIGRRGDKDVVLVDKDGNVVERPAAAAPAEPPSPAKRSGVKAYRGPAVKPRGPGDAKTLGRKRR